MKILALLLVVSVGCILGAPLSFSGKISFVINVIFLVYSAVLILRSKEFDPFAINTFIFYYLFFIVAPVVQIFANNKTLVNGLPLDQGNILFTNSIILLSYLILFFTSFNKTSNKLSSGKKSYSGKSQTSVSITILIAICVFVTAFSLPLVIGNVGLQKDFSGSGDKLSYLIFGKFVLMVPFAALLVLLNYSSSFKRQQFVIAFVILLGCVLLIYNPLLAKRNAIGPIYLTVTYFLFRRKMSTNRNFMFASLILFVVFFPLSSIFTHSSGTVEQKVAILNSGSTINLPTIIFGHFSELHYDSWDMVYSTVGYVASSGVSFGYFLAGSIFFFVPRSVWPDKPLGSGEIVINNHVSKFGMDFTNVSCPLPAEGYINFGIFGVILLAFLLGRIYRKFNRDLQNHSESRYLSVHFSFYIFFLLRGDLMNGIAYYCGFRAAYFAVHLFAATIRRKAVNGREVELSQM